MKLSSRCMGIGTGLTFWLLLPTFELAKKHILSKHYIDVHEHQTTKTRACRHAIHHPWIHDPSTYSGYQLNQPIFDTKNTRWPKTGFFQWPGWLGRALPQLEAKLCLKSKGSWHRWIWCTKLRLVGSWNPIIYGAGKNTSPGANLVDFFYQQYLPSHAIDFMCGNLFI